jgi:predicted RNase H-like HicB family nuclease
MRKQYIALLHKADDAGYQVSFPDFPGAVTAATRSSGQGRRSCCTSNA